MTSRELTDRRGMIARTAGIAAVCALLTVLFHVQGNTVDVEHFGPSAISWMTARWDDTSGMFSHGWLIPGVSLALVWWRRRQLAAAPRGVGRPGLVVVAASLLLHFIGNRAMLPHLSVVAMVGLSWGIPCCLAGPAVGRILLFPCAYLGFCVPMNFLNTLTFPLRRLASAVAVTVLNGLSIPSTRIGTTIHSAVMGGYSLDVADACSGLRYVLAISALTALYAYLTQKSLVKKWVLFAACIPMAVAGNITRIVVIGIAARFLGREAALGIYHDLSGYIVFGTVIVLMMAAGSALNAVSGRRALPWMTGKQERT